MIIKFKIFENIKDTITAYNAENYSDYFIATDAEEAISWCQGKPVPTPNFWLYPVSSDVIKFSLGDYYYDKTEEEIEEWVRGTCWWYDGTMKSISGGLNLYKDFQNSTWSDFVVGLKEKEDAEISDFEDDQYSFARRADMVYPVFVYDCRTKIFYKPEKFELEFTAKKYNL